jgi:protein-disulfide isomerase
VASKSKKRLQKRARASQPQRRPPATPRSRLAGVPTQRRSERRRSTRAVSESRSQLYAYAAGAAVLIGVLLIGLSQISVHRGAAAAAPQQPAGIAGIVEASRLFEGIPQHGNVLGSPKAPVRLIEYADPQCPYCAQYTRFVMPTLVREYVRTGKVQLVYRGLGFLGPDSGTALRTATAAGAQNRFWNVIDLLYQNQGPENGWVTDEVLRAIVTGAGADANRVFAERDRATVTATVDKWMNLAQVQGIRAVPSFFIAKRGRPLSGIQLHQIDAAEFRAPLDRALRG